MTISPSTKLKKNCMRKIQNLTILCTLKVTTKQKTYTSKQGRTSEKTNHLEIMNTQKVKEGRKLTNTKIEKDQNI